MPAPLAVPEWRVRVGHFYFVLCATLIINGWTAYLVAQRFRLYLGAWIACAILLPYFILGRTRIPLRPPWRALALLGSFHLLTLLSANWSADPELALRWARLDLLWLAVFVVAVAWAQGMSDVWISGFYVVLGLTGAVGAILFLWTVGAIVDPEAGSFRNTFALVFSCSLPFLLWRARFAYAGGSAALAGFAVVSLLLTGSRSALLAMPVALGGTAWIHLRNSRRRARWGVGLGIIAAVSTVALAQVPAVARGVSEARTRLVSETSLVVSSSLVAASRDEVDLERRAQAYAALLNFREHPLLGEGYMGVATRTEEIFGSPVTAHGIPFMLLGETGLVGTMLYAALLWGAFARIRRRLRAADGDRERSFYMTLALTLCVILLIGLFHQVYRTPEFYVTLAFAYAADLTPRLAYRGAATPVPRRAAWGAFARGPDVEEGFAHESPGARAAGAG